MGISVRIIFIVAMVIDIVWDLIGFDIVVDLIVSGSRWRRWHISAICKTTIIRIRGDNWLMWMCVCESLLSDTLEIWVFPRVIVVSTTKNKNTYTYGFGFGISFEWSSQTGAGSRNGGCGGGIGVVVGGRIGPVFVPKSTRIDNTVEITVDSSTTEMSHIWWQTTYKQYSGIDRIK